VLLAVACGARTDLGGHVDEEIDASTDAHPTHDAIVVDAIGVDVIGVDASQTCDDFTNDPTPQATTDLGTACDEGENTSTPPTNTCGTVGVAWEWVPDHDMAVSRLELWTQGGNQVAFVALGSSDARGVWMLPVNPVETTRQLLDRYARALGVPVKTTRVPKWVLRGAGVFAKQLGETVEMIYQWEQPYVVDDAKFRATFGFGATPWDEAIRATTDWARATFLAAA